MTYLNVLTQYQSEVIEAFNSATNISNPFEKVHIDTLKLFMAILDKINFLQMGRYGSFSQQTYWNTFIGDEFDWFAFNLFLANRVCTGKFRTIAVDPSFIPKAGNKALRFWKFWSGAAASMKRGLELLGIGLIDIGNHDCMPSLPFRRPMPRPLRRWTTTW